MLFLIFFLIFFLIAVAGPVLGIAEHLVLDPGQRVLEDRAQVAERVLADGLGVPRRLAQFPAEVEREPFQVAEQGRVQAGGAGPAAAAPPAGGRAPGPVAGPAAPAGPARPALRRGPVGPVPGRGAMGVRAAGVGSVGVGAVGVRFVGVRFVGVLLAGAAIPFLPG